MKKLTIVVILFSVISSSCTKDITSQNINSKLPLTAPSSAVFLAGEKGLVDVYTTEFWGTAPFRVISQVWTQNTFNNEAHYQFATNNSPGGWWNGIYNLALHNLDQAKTLFVNDVPDSNVLKNDVFIADILEVYAFSLLVNTYGPVPYGEALKRNIPFPKYDSQQTIEYDLISRLDKAITGLDPNYASLGPADRIYSGNVSQWKKFASSLKLKLGLLISDVDPQNGKTIVEEAVSSGVFSSNSDNAVLTYDSTSVVNSNPIWQDLINAPGLLYYSPASYFINTLVSWNDPRLPLYFTKDPNGNYSGGIAGAGNSSTTLSSFSDQWLGAGFPGNILDNSEVQFLLAEAVERGYNVPGTADVYYDSAISSSIRYWGGTDADVSAYIVQPDVAYATADGPWRQKIGYQKWIAFANRNWDSWTEIRRLGFPDLNTVSPPVGAQGNLPTRFYYPPAEQTSNSVNWSAAVATLPGGQDVQSAKLFWQP